MTISKCVDMALKRAGKSKVEMTSYWGFSFPQTLAKKFSRESWSGEDLVRLAQFTGGELMLVYPEGDSIQILTDKVEEAQAEADE